MRPEQETDRENKQDREIRRKRWIIALLLILAVVLILTVAFLLLTKGGDKVENTQVNVISVNKTEVVIPITINNVTIDCIIDKESKNDWQQVIITRQAAIDAGCNIEIDSDGDSFTHFAISCGDILLPNIYAQVQNGYESEIRVGLGWFMKYIGKIKVNNSVAIILGGYSESRVKGMMFLIFACVLLVFYVVGRVMMSKDMMVITVGGFDKFLIFAAALALLVSVFANDVDGGEKVVTVSLIVSGIAVAISLAMTVMANIANPIFMIIAVFAKIFVILFILFVLFVLVAWLMVRLAASAANRDEGGWEVVGWSDTLDAYVGIRR